MSFHGMTTRFFGLLCGRGIILAVTLGRAAMRSRGVFVMRRGV
jgi:hypothetical protein